MTPSWLVTVHRRFPLLTHLAHLVTHFSTAPCQPQLILLYLCELDLCLSAFVFSAEMKKPERGATKHLFCVLLVDGRTTSNENICRENSFQYMFMAENEFLICCGKSKKEKNVHTLLWTHPLRSHASSAGPHTHTHKRTCSPTHKGVSGTVCCCLE